MLGQRCTPWCWLGLHVSLKLQSTIEFYHGLVYADGLSWLVVGRKSLTVSSRGLTLKRGLKPGSPFLTHLVRSFRWKLWQSFSNLVLDIRPDMHGTFSFLSLDQVIFCPGEFVDAHHDVLACIQLQLFFLLLAAI